MAPGSLARGAHGHGGGTAGIMSAPVIAADGSLRAQVCPSHCKLFVSVPCTRDARSVGVTPARLA